MSRNQYQPVHENHGRNLQERRSASNNGGDGISVPKFAEIIVGNLRRQIVRGELQDGELLPPESELMARFKVSRPTMREAFRILESERLIMLRRGSLGARVCRPDPRVGARYTSLLLQYEGVTMADVFSARTLLESRAARLIAESNRSTTKRALREALEMEERSLEEVADGSGANRFHHALLDLCGNSTLRLLGCMLDEIVESNYGVTIDPSDRSLRGIQHRGIRAHGRLVALIEQGKSEEAESFWARHMKEAAAVRFRDGSGSAVVDLLD